MQKIQSKLELLYLPFLAVAIGFISAYTLIHWLFFIKFHLFPLKEEILNLWGPMAFSPIAVFIWLRPRIKLLKLRTKSGDLPGLYFFILAAAIASPTCVSQSYLQTATGKLTRLTDISQIDQNKTSKYYTLDKFYFDRDHISMKPKFSVSGKNNQTFNMHLYVVVPILTARNDTTNPTCHAWYGIKYYKSISNRLAQEDKEEQYNLFVNACQRQFDGTPLSQYSYLDRIGNTDDYPGYLGAISTNKTFAHTSTAILVPIDEPYESRNGNKLTWIFSSFAIGAVLWLILILIPKIDEISLKKFQRGTLSKSDGSNWPREFIVPRKGFFITPIIAELNILIFFCMVFAGLGLFSFDTPDLLAWGADYRPAVSQGQWWRLITSMFLHGGILHLAANIYGLFLAGYFLEPVLGRTKFALVYLISGILASLSSLWWHPATVSVGASGAIFGLYGAFLALIIAKVYTKISGKAFLPMVLVFIGYNVIVGFSNSGIDNAAHIGGLVSGFLIGMFLSGNLKEEEQVAVE